MFRIRRIYDTVIPANKTAISQVQSILKTQFPFIREEEIRKIPDVLRNPLKHGFRSILFVADDLRGNVQGFSLLLHEPNLNFCYLDYISSARKIVGRGIGAALYQRTRYEALQLGVIGIFFECLPDDPELSRNEKIREQNMARLKFYERFGARPVINTAYETSLDPEDDNPPYLVFDDLGQNIPLSRREAQSVVKVILERKYAEMCPREYVDMVVSSFKDDPVRLRKPRYIRKEIRVVEKVEPVPNDQKITLVINDKHDIHHVRERGYVESPIRIKTILQAIEGSGLFREIPVKKFPEKYIRSVHDIKFINYFKKVCFRLPEGKSIYPYVFPIRNATRPPKELAVRAGYFCIDTFTPLNRNAYLAAKRAVDCALTSVESILAGTPLAYALIRPPGHHAEWSSFGGFCYFNSNAAAADYLSRYGKVAILDIDYHHGNGQQDIFYQRDDVLTISIHGHPSFAYPYFSGFSSEKGFGSGEGFNVNYPLPEKVDGRKYRQTLESALKKITKFRADFLIVALGLDTARGDPTGSWNLSAKDFSENGRLIGQLKIPVLVVQEGGYNQRNIGINVRNFFNGLLEGFFGKSEKS
ncbi:MAG: histone deacetylase family protein [Calditrichaeota bacterium]|nr:histone deacetylase family protein [Calditrichota bacterium]RQW02658.1 MAG: histone deacetylase family protein [Calditrichota bacterium]